MELLIIFTILLLTFASPVKGKILNDTEWNQNTNCSSENQTLVVYEGWPQIIECPVEKEYYDEYDATYYYEDYGGKWVTCEISFSSNGSVVGSHRFNSSLEKPFYKTSDLHANSSTSYTAHTQSDDGSYCTSIVVTFKVKPMPTASCTESAKGGTVKVSKYAGEPVNLDCKPTNEFEYKLQPGMLDKVSVDWFYNCGPLPPDVAVRNAKDNEMVFNRASIDSVTFKHPGLYSCAVTYKGMRLYIIHYSVCVREKLTAPKPAIKCPQQTYRIKKLGEKVTINCTVDLGFGASNQEISSRWEKLQVKDKDNEKNRPRINFVCVTDAMGNIKGPSKPRSSKHRCCRSATEMDKTCYTSPTNNSQRTPMIFELRLYLVDIQKEDLGVYRVRFRTNPKNAAYYNVTIEMDETPEVQFQILTIALGVGVGLLFLLILLLLLVFRFYVAVYCMIWFGKYHDDDKQYGAFISYYFSTSLDAFAQQQSRDLRAAVCDQLESLHFTIYDEHKNGAVEYRAERMISMMEQCHRVVVLLTAEYVKDHWNIFQLQQGFKGMIESGSKVIFVLVPGIKEYIKQQAESDDTCRMILRALELNTVISWSPQKTRNRRFALELCYGMPKLKPRMSEKKRISSNDNDFSIACISEKCPIDV